MSEEMCLSLLPLALSLLSLSFYTFSFPATVAANASNPPSPIESPPPPPPSHFLKEVLKVISVQKGWNLEDIRISDVDVRSARVGSLQRYEFRLRIGKSYLLFRFSDEISPWKKLRRGELGLESIGRIGSKPVIKGLKLEGPLELRVDGNDELSLLLPLNTTITGLKRVLVGEGIAVQVKGAQEVNLAHPYNYGLPINRSLVSYEAGNKQYLPFGYTACTPLLPVHISGSASLVAYRTHNPTAHIQTTFLSPSTIELLPNKCYSGYYRKDLACPIYSLCSRLSLVERLLRSFLGDRIFQNRSSGLLKAKITASTIVRFQLELERDLGNNDAIWDTLAAWRTKPKIERVWFEIVARVEAERLKPLMVKKVRPFVAADTTAWSNLMSNVSFTQFPSVVVPPEALTLDVKW